MHVLISSAASACALSTQSGSDSSGRAIEISCTCVSARICSAACGMLMRFDATTGMSTCSATALLMSTNALLGTEVTMVGHPRLMPADAGVDDRRPGRLDFGSTTPPQARVPTIVTSRTQQRIRRHQQRGGRTRRHSGGGVEPHQHVAGRRAGPRRHARAADFDGAATAVGSELGRQSADRRRRRDQHVHLVQPGMSGPRIRAQEGVVSAQPACRAGDRPGALADPPHAPRRGGRRGPCRVGRRGDRR